MGEDGRDNKTNMSRVALSAYPKTTFWAYARASLRPRIPSCINLYVGGASHSATPQPQGASLNIKTLGRPTCKIPNSFLISYTGPLNFPGRSRRVGDSDTVPISLAMPFFPLHWLLTFGGQKHRGKEASPRVPMQTHSEVWKHTFIGCSRDSSKLARVAV
jgi:hypothetical protein